MNVKLSGLVFVCAGFAAGTALPAGAEVVPFKDAAKITSWDAWSDHKTAAERKKAKLRPCVTWNRLKELDCGLKPSGFLETRPACGIAASKWSIGCETMDRDYADWDQFKEYVGLLGAKRGRLFSGWAKTEQIGRAHV